MIKVFDLKKYKLREVKSLTPKLLGSEFKRVPDLVVFKKNKKRALLYSYLSNRLFDLPAGLFDKINGGERLHFSELAEEKLYARGWPVSFETGAPTIYLNTSKQCNLNCDYCRSSAGETRLLTENKAKALLGELLDALGKNVFINFGVSGEPSFDFGRLKRIAAFALEKNPEAKLTISTNGFLEAREAEWIAENFYGIGISYDGTPELHDLHRKTASGKKSSGKVENSIRVFSKKNCNFTVNAVLTRDSIGKEKQIVKNVKKLGAKNLNIVPFREEGRGKKFKAPEGEKFNRSIKKFFLEGFRQGLDVDLSGTIKRQGIAFGRSCNFSQIFAIGTDGTVSGCVNFMGKEEYKNAKKMEKLEKKKARMGKITRQSLEIGKFAMMKEKSMENCRGCEFYWICAGGCYIRKKSGFAGKECVNRRILTGFLKSYLEAVEEFFLKNKGKE